MIPSNIQGDAQFAGVFAAIGLALATIGSAISSVVSGFMALSWWQMPLAIIGILLLISGPSMILTAMKLHRRNLGSILDANGWAINTRARINITMGHYMTSVATLPKDSKRCFDDPFEEEKSHWKTWLALIIATIIALFCFLPGFSPYRRNICNFMGWTCSSDTTETNNQETPNVASATTTVTSETATK